MNQTNKFKLRCPKCNLEMTQIQVRCPRCNTFLQDLLTCRGDCKNCKKHQC